MIYICPFCYCSLVPVEKRTYHRCPKCPDVTFDHTKGQIISIHLYHQDHLAIIYPEKKMYIYSIEGNRVIELSKPPIYRGPAPILDLNVIHKKIHQILNLKAFL